MFEFRREPSSLYMASTESTVFSPFCIFNSHLSNAPKAGENYHHLKKFFRRSKNKLTFKEKAEPNWFGFFFV